MPKSSDPIVLSIETATDSRDFELLCCDILAGTVFPGVEPIGGTGDGGRDALYSDTAASTVTVCAFSLRKDWIEKLDEDCNRVKSLKHKCDNFLFATSMQPTPAERDDRVRHVRDVFGWSLDLYGRERLATAIRGKVEHLIELHPSIFRKAHFRLAGGRLLDTSHRELLLLDHVDRDQGFAHWVARCLRLLGYDVWCRGIDSTGGEIADTAIRELLEKRARHHLPIFSDESLSSPELRGRVEQSAAGDRRLLPLRIEAVDTALLSQRVRSIDPLPFEANRAEGMRILSAILEEWGVPKDTEVLQGRRRGIRLPNPNDFLRNVPETVLSNVFSVVALPTVVKEWMVLRNFNKPELQSARQLWPFVKSGDCIFSFVNPPEEIQHMVRPRLWMGAEWRDVEKGYYDGKDARDVISELLKRTLEFAFYRAGLLWCPETELIYFDHKAFFKKKIAVKQPTGGSNRRSVCGEKFKWRAGGKGENYNWQLAPDCRCFGGNRDPWEIRTRVMLRVTYDDGTPIESKRVITFRRHAANGWNQGKFRDLNLLFMQFAAAEDSMIVVGDGLERVAINAIPQIFNSPVSLDELALPKGSSKFAKRVERQEEEFDEQEIHE